MPTRKKPHSSDLIRNSACLLLWSALLADFTYGQAAHDKSRKDSNSSDKAKIADLIDKAKPDTPESIFFAVQLADAKAVQAIPMLEEKFARIENRLTEAKILGASVTVADFDKANIASALVRLGDKNDTYWEFLLAQANLAVTSGVPEYLIYDEQGKAGPGPSQEVSAWAKAHHVHPAAIEEEGLLALPAAVDMLGRTGDRRAIPLLRQALLSPNYQIRIAAANGLANIQDKESIPFIKDACHKAPADAAASIASASLVYFDDPEAQSAAETYIPRERLKVLREDKHLPGGDPFR